MIKFNKIVAGLLSALTVSAMCIATSVFATDYTNPTDQYGYPYIPNTLDTQWYAGNDYCRPKFNNSSIYVQNVSMLYGAYVDVAGRETATGYNYSVSIGSYYTTNIYLPANRTGEIYQGIAEHRNPKLNYAHITFRKANSSAGVASGNWSPDCAGTYDEVLND